MRFRINMLGAFFAASALLAAGAIHYLAPAAFAQSSYYSSRGCVNCHPASPTTCNGCHHHGNSGLKAATNKTSYAPGETVTATLSGGSRSGWVRAVLYDQNNAQVAISSGNNSGMGSSTSLPASLSAPAPATPGAYTWHMAYFGNQDGTGAGDVHSEVRVNTNSFTVVAPADTTAPVVNTFTLPASGTSLTVPVTALAATDNVAVTGYMVTTSSSQPAAGDAGWSPSAPTTATAAAEGSVTFYAWAKDAAGNISTSLSATVVITLPDVTAPTVDIFTMPASASSLTVPVTAFTASDNLAVTGYMITTGNNKPAAGDAAWSATAPTSATANSQGSVTFYAWAKDAAGNVSSNMSATVTITLIVQNQLSVTVNGSGSGTVTSIPAGVTCLSGSVAGCSAGFDSTATVTLSQSISSGSVFAGWGGDCSGFGTATDCVLDMTAARSVTATFDSAPAQAMIGITGYPTLASAYAAAVDGDTIKIAEATISGELTIDKAITLDGGYNAAITDKNGGPTILSGSMTIGNGSLTASDVAVM